MTITSPVASTYGQARTCLHRIADLFDAASAAMDDIVRLRIYVTDIGGRSDIG